MTVSLFPLQATGVSFGEEVFFKMLDHLFAPGVLGALDLQVIQKPAGANLSVTVKAGEGYVSMASGGKRLAWATADSNSGAPGALNSADWLATFAAAHASYPRIDAVVLLAQDSLTDGGSGQYRARFKVVGGAPTAGATLANLSGSPATPANSILLAYVLVAAGSTSIVTAQILDQRTRSTNGGGVAQSSSAIPGALWMWASDVLPNSAEYGHWTWADGSVLNEADYPRTSRNTSATWKTHNGKADPGTGKFRVPDMRGASPLGADDMGTGAACRMSRAGASIIGSALGEETHALSAAELASHAHACGTLVTASESAHTHSNTFSIAADGSHAHNTTRAAKDFLITTGTPRAVTLSILDAGTTSVSTDAAGSHGHGISGGVGAGTAHAHGVTGETSSAGSGVAHNNVQPSNVVGFIVKLDD